MTLECRCTGIDQRTHCQNLATQEDGLCDTCRCPHGGCDQHGIVRYSVTDVVMGRASYEDHMASFREAWVAMHKCQEAMKREPVDGGGS